MERQGKYLWSPQKNKKGSEVWHWNTMLEVRPGDIVFNNFKSKIPSYCIAKSKAYESVKPNEFAHDDWNEIGWKVDVEYFDLNQPLVIKEHLDSLMDLFPKKHSPYSISAKKANQIYLASLSDELGRALCEIANISFEEFEPEAGIPGLNKFKFTNTEKEYLLKQRVTQGKFRNELITRYQGKCAITGLDVQPLLVASHIKPWSVALNSERNDIDNGLLLTAHLDKLFDKFLISFDVAGKIIISNQLSHKQRDLLNISPSMRLQNLTEGNQRYLNYHRNCLKK